MERWPSGRRRTPGKRVGSKRVSRVRIPFSPPFFGELELSWVIYLLECSDGSYYTGITDNLEDRLERHSTGRGARYTKIRLPIKLKLTIPAKNQSEAVLKEKWLK